jgi:hypothetical protein
MAGRKRRLWPSAITTPALSQAATARSALDLSRVNGLSTNTCLPAAAALITCSACWVCGVASTTAFTAGSRSTAS